MSSSDPLRYLLNSRIDRRCFLCGKARVGGHRFVAIEDLVLLQILLQRHQSTKEIFSSCPTEMLLCLKHLFSTHSDLSELRRQIDHLMEQSRKLSTIYDPQIVCLEANKLFVPRRKGVPGGVPICWRDCSFSDSLQAILKWAQRSGVSSVTSFDSLPTEIANSLSVAVANHGSTQQSYLQSTITDTGSVIRDSPFVIGSYINYNTDMYEIFLVDKVKIIRDLFEPFFASSAQPRSCDDSRSTTGSSNSSSVVEIEVIRSPLKYFRQRCRFAIIHDKSEVFFHMWDEDGSLGPRIEVFPIAAKLINDLLGPLRVELDCNEELRCGLKSVHFLCTLIGHMVIKLHYERPLEESLWTKEVKILRHRLRSYNVDGLESLNIIGRAPRQTITVETDIVEEKFTLSDGRTIRYKQSADGFSNPNAQVNIKCLDWLCDVVSKIIPRRGSLAALTEEHDEDIYRNPPNVATGNNTDSGSACTNNQERSSCGHDLLELYCGMGNHTMALAKFARNIVAVELNKSLCAAAEENLKLNNITNAKIIACDSEKFTKSILKKRVYVHTIRDDDSGESSATGTVVKIQVAAGKVDGSGSFGGNKTQQRKEDRKERVENNTTKKLLSQEYSSDNDTGGVHAADIYYGSGGRQSQLQQEQQYHDEDGGGKAHKMANNTFDVRKSTCNIAATAAATTATYSFSTVLVDPPRSGLDSTTRRLVCNYDNIIYISCNPEALRRDLDMICKYHDIRRFAVFDQFAYTNHLECGVYLTRKSSTTE